MNFKTALLSLGLSTVLFGGCYSPDVSQKEAKSPPTAPPRTRETIDIPTEKPEVQVEQIETELMNLEILEEDFSDI